MNFKLFGAQIFLLLLLDSVACTTIACAAEPARSETITTARLETLVKSANVIKPGAQFTASAAGQEVLVWTDRNPKALDNDLKIDAMLISKAVLDAYPNYVMQVKVLYSEGPQNAQSKCSQIAVTAANVRSFDAHAVTVDQLLDTLELTAASGMTPGPFREKRLQLLGRIDNLKARGTGVLPFEILFGKIAAMVQTSPEKEVLDKITDLSQKLSTQEDLVRQAERTASGKGVPQSSRASAGGFAAPAVSRSVPGATPNYPGGNSPGQTFGGGWTLQDKPICEAIEQNIQRLRATDPAKAAEFFNRHEEVKHTMLSGNADQARSMNRQLLGEVESAVGRLHP